MGTGEFNAWEVTLRCTSIGPGVSGIHLVVNAKELAPSRLKTSSPYLGDKL